jgi:hypothetical protein
MMILLVGFEMLGQILYSPAEKGDLNLRRSRIPLMGLEISDYLSFLLFI